MLDINKPIRLGRAKGKTTYPSKTMMNLVQREKTEWSLSRSVPTILIMVVLVGLFIKFGIVDQYLQVAQADRQVAQVQTQLDTLDTSLIGYSSLKAEYAQYSTDYLSSDSASLVDRTTILNMIESTLMSEATVTSVAITGNDVTLSITGASLTTVGEMARQIQGLSSVSSVSVSTATSSTSSSTSTTTGSDTVNATMKVTMTASNNGGGA
jgi:hypothetical protein